MTETADKRQARLRAAGEPTHADWSNWCSVPDFCQESCVDCRLSAQIALEEA